MIWKFLAKIYEEVQEPELKLQITTYFMNFKKNWLLQFRAHKNEKEYACLDSFWLVQRHPQDSSECGEGQTMYNHLVEKTK